MKVEKKEEIKKHHKHLRNGFFTELCRAFDDFIIILPDEEVDLMTYKSLARNTKNPKDQENFMDSFRYLITDKFEKHIRNKDTNFFTSNSDQLMEHHKNDRYGGEAMEWINKLKNLWKNGKITVEHSDVVWNYLIRLMDLCLMEKKYRDKLN